MHVYSTYSLASEFSDSKAVCVCARVHACVCVCVFAPTPVIHRPCGVRSVTSEASSSFMLLHTIHLV